VFALISERFSQSLHLEFEGWARRAKPYARHRPHYAQEIILHVMNCGGDAAPSYHYASHAK
jgi:hypothetical protein